MVVVVVAVVVFEEERLQAGDGGVRRKADQIRGSHIGGCRSYGPAVGRGGELDFSNLI